ncbi:carboxymuconolactone decarboxylase family protein [Namhaeicola litoreus]|uniref:Carboxymuconolactone decarboxylase family protein n=1 Tax=Namhaeicola litoreus TaxID=1052145 RepID=A0ABW3XZI9_9FLAO
MRKKRIGIHISDQLRKGLVLLGLFTLCLNAQDISKQMLTSRQHSMVAIAALTAVSDYPALKTALNEGLESNLTIAEIKEVMVHLYPYCGFPKSIRGLQTLMEVLEERKLRGIMDEMGREATPLNDERSKYQRGKENLEKLIGRPITAQSAYAEFTPIIEIFLKEHLFADIFDRDVLTYAERELVTVSVLSAIGKVEPMLRAHLNICIYQGYSPEQLQQFIKIIDTVVGEKEAQEALLVLNEVLHAEPPNE